MPLGAGLAQEIPAGWWPQLHATVSQIPVMLVAVDSDGIIRAAAGAGFQAVAWVPDGLVGRSGHAVGEISPDLWQALRRSLAGEAVMATSCVGDRTCQVSCQPMRDHAGRVTGAVAVCTDVTDRVRTEQALRYRATHDPLTGLPNRALLHDRLGQALRVAERTNAAVAVLLMDLDRFKPVNVTLGHAAGDALLKRVATCLTATLRAVDSVSRLGGDEFVVVLRGDGRDGAMRVARHIQNRLASMDIRTAAPGASRRVSVSHSRPSMDAMPRPCFTARTRPCTPKNGQEGATRCTG